MRQSPARAEPHDATAWLPLPAPDTLPHVDDLLTADAPADPIDAPVVPSPARAEPHDETSWLPLPELEGLPSIQQMLTPVFDVEAPTARDHPVANPSPARAEPHDATSWLPLPEMDGLPQIDHLVEGEGDNGGSGGRRRPHRRSRRRFHLPVRSLLVGLVVVGTVGGAYWAGAQALDPGADVTVRVDGKRIESETGVSTVASLLSEQKIELGDNDRVEPPPTAEIENGMTVNVVRAFPVPVDFDGEQMTIDTTWSEPAEFLSNLRLGTGDVGFLSKPVEITEGTQVILRTKKVGTLFLDGQAIEYKAAAWNVKELIDQYQVLLGPADFTTPALSEVVPVRGSVTVTRVDTLTETVEEPYDLPPEVQPDPNLDVGQSREAAPVTGLQSVTYQITNNNDKEAGRVAISKVPINPASPHITYFGTKYNPLWDKMAQCETGGNWAAQGPRYQGGLGIFFQTWNGNGGREFAENAGDATKFEQIIVAERIRTKHGWHAWGCADDIGL